MTLAHRSSNGGRDSRALAPCCLLGPTEAGVADHVRPSEASAGRMTQQGSKRTILVGFLAGGSSPERVRPQLRHLRDATENHVDKKNALL